MVSVCPSVCGGKQGRAGQGRGRAGAGAGLGQGRAGQGGQLKVSKKN